MDSAPKASAAARHAAFLASIYLSMGAATPFLPLFLADRGLAPAAVTLVLGLGQIARLIGTPLGAAIADRTGDRRSAAALFALLAAASAGLMLAAVSLPSLALAAMLHGLFAGPLPPMADAFALAAAARGELTYGVVRSVGSAAFLIGTLATGALIEPFGAASVVAVQAVCTALAAIAVFALPRLEVPALARLSRIARLLSRRDFVVVLLGAGLVHGSHAGFFAFSALHWTASGLSAETIAALWSIGVAAEILLLIGAGRSMRRVTPRHLAIAAAVAAVLRWVTLAFTTAPAALVASQCLHAASYGGMLLAAALLVAAILPPELAASGQALLAALGPGAWTLGLTLLAGPVYGRYGAALFLVMALVAAAGLGVVALTWRAESPGGG